MNVTVDKNLVNEKKIRADLTNYMENEGKYYIGLAGVLLKQRYRNYRKSFRSGRYKNETDLTKHI